MDSRSDSGIRSDRVGLFRLTAGVSFRWGCGSGRRVELSATTEATGSNTTEPGRSRSSGGDRLLGYARRDSPNQIRVHDASATVRSTALLRRPEVVTRSVAGSPSAIPRRRGGFLHQPHRLYPRSTEQSRMLIYPDTVRRGPRHPFGLLSVAPSAARLTRLACRTGTARVSASAGTDEPVPPRLQRPDRHVIAARSRRKVIRWRQLDTVERPSPQGPANRANRP